jgi:hypothetical protein
MLALALQQLEVATLSCCSGLKGMGVLGMVTLVQKLLVMAI